MERPFFSHQFLHCVQEVGPVHGKDVERATNLSNSFSSSPARRSSSSLISSRSSRHFAVLRNWPIPLAWRPPVSSVPGVATHRASVSPRTFMARETCCWSGSYHCRNVNVLPKTLAVRDCDDPGPNFTTLLSSYALCNRLSACFRPSRRPTMKNRHRAPGCWSASLHGRNGTEKPRLGKILAPPRPGRDVLPTVEQHPRVHTSSFVVFHRRLAALPLGPRSAIGHIRRAPHQRRNGLDSHLQLRSTKGLKREKCLPDTQHRVELAGLPRALLLRRSVRPLHGSVHTRCEQ